MQKLELEVGDVVRIEEYVLTILKVTASHIEVGLDGPGISDNETAIILTDDELTLVPQ